MNQQKNKMAISPEFSVYLDLLRFLAAIFVLLYHVRYFEIGPLPIRSFIPNHGHDFVILFFVLSGYVIAASVDRKRSKGLREYALDRTARVYSVAIPTLIFCALLGIIYQVQHDPEIRWESAINREVISFFVNVFFVGQSWSFNPPFANIPYWSLCYEVMYYVGFGIFAFMSGRIRWLGIGLVAVISGPKIILLLPCWILGVVAYEARDKWILKAPLAIGVAFILPPLILVALHYIGFGPRVRALSQAVLDGDLHDKLDFSKNFLVDYVTALLVAANLYAVRNLSLHWPASIKTLASGGASMSFTLYLLHFPLIMIAMKLIGKPRDGMLVLLVVVIVVPFVCYVVSSFTELRRPALRAWLDRIVH